MPDGSWTIDIAASASDVWRLISDPTNTPKWSPVCHAVVWLEGDSETAVGARFRGSSRMNGARWSRECRFTRVEEARHLAWSTYFRGAESTRWRFLLEPTSDGTRLTESYEIVSVPPWIRAMWRIPGSRSKSARDTDRNICASLERIKGLVEGHATP